MQGFIRNEPFDPHAWTIPGDKPESLKLEELVIKGKKIYVHGKRKLNRKIIADVVEALIGAFISTEDEKAALSFINWIGINVDTNIMPYENERHISIIAPEELVKAKLLKSRLNYSFKDPYLLVEALTHSSGKRPEIRTCYEVLS